MLVLADFLLHDEAGGFELLLKLHGDLGQLGPVRERAKFDAAAVGGCRFRPLLQGFDVGGVLPLRGGPGESRAEEAFGDVRPSFVDPVNNGGPFDRRPCRCPDRRIRERTPLGVQVKGVGAGHGDFVDQVRLDLGDLAYGNGLHDVGRSGPEGGSACRAVGNVLDVDAAARRFLAPVVGEAVECCRAGAVRGRQDVGPVPALMGLTTPPGL